MIKSIVHPINYIHGYLEGNNVNIDSLDFIESRCMEKGCQQNEFCIGCSSRRLSTIKNIKSYLQTKLEDLKLQTVDYKSHFKMPCFNCSSSYHGSNYADGYFNLQKMFEVENECVACQRNFTTERSFFHNCNICNEPFENCHLLAHHRRKEHNSKKPHQCAACNLSVSNSNLVNHIFKHKLPHMCPYCNKRYATTLNLKLHILSHTGERPFSCKFCPKTYSKKQNLDIHLFEHTGGKQFKCDLCDKTFATRGYLHQHKTVHMERLFQCKYCPKQYNSKWGLDYHLFKHTGGKQFKCDLCDKTFAKKFALERHKSVHTERSFQCKYCLKQYKTQKYLDVHLFEHTGIKQFKCDLCEKTFATLHLLKNHKSVHMGRSFQCKYCNKQYKNKQGLDYHMFEHTGDKQYKCDLCDKTFAKRYVLERHKPIHMGRSFECEYCFKKYKNKQGLDYHLFEHTDGKQFKCDLCDKTFTTQYLLKQHKRVHTEKSFQCKYCPKKYSTKYNLDTHLFEHIGVKQFNCDLCEKTFATRWLLNRHKQVHMQTLFQCPYCPMQYKAKYSLDIHMIEHIGGMDFPATQ